MADSPSSPMRAEKPAGRPTKYTETTEIDRILATSKPSAVARSGKAYRDFAAKYDTIAKALQNLGGDLHDAWQGKDAAAAQTQLRDTWASAATINKIADDFGAALQNGSANLAWYKNRTTPSKDLKEARHWMTGANQRLTQTWNNLPPDIATSLPQGSRRDDHGPAVTDRSGPGAPGAPGSPSPSNLPGDPPAGHGTHFGAGHSGNGLPPHGGSHLPGSSGTDLAGSAPPITTGPGLPGAGSIPGSNNPFGPGAGSLPHGTPLGNGVGPGLQPPLTGGGLLPGAGKNGPGTTPNGSNSGRIGPMGSKEGTLSPAAAAAAEEAQAAEAAAAARSGLAGPVIGGPAGETEKRERTRETWLAEDEEVWTGGRTVAPPVIGSENRPANESETTSREQAETQALIAELRAKLDQLAGKAAEGSPKSLVDEDIDAYISSILEGDL